MQTVLITGGAGYVGSGLLQVLLAEGYRVVAVDKLSFGGESLLYIWDHPNFSFHKCDICDYPRLDRILESEQPDAVIHLAAIVGDPACKREPETAVRINWEASRRLIERCGALKVGRFVLASTCSNYGKMSDPGAYVDERSALAPVSLYAELKVRLERYLLEETPRRDDFSPVALRFATVYGLSPRMRFDLTVNEFAKEIALGRELVVFGEQFWRPYCHVSDFARAFLAVLRATHEKIAQKVYNVGDTGQNFTKQMIVDEIRRMAPDARITYVKQVDDPRDYRVNCDLIKRELGFSTTRTVPQGIREVYDVVRLGAVRDPDDQRYYNVPYVRPQ
ncbi:MAG: NAD(P)-dependent oxidoreductase [Steroidobacteraceae bacterium]